MRLKALGWTLALVATLYTLTLGGTFNGLVEPRFRYLSLGGLTLVVVIWLLVRWRGQWAWHRGPLDVAIVLWVAAFGMSLYTNMDAWRRIVIGLWFMGLYLGIFSILLDTLSNRGLTRESLTGALLAGGLLLLVFGYIQVATFYAAGGGIPRPVSTLGNPNSLAAVLVVLVPLALGQVVLRTGVLRTLYTLYALAAALLLVMTRSRGAWIGAGAGLLVLGILLLLHFDLLSLRQVVARWRALRTSARAAAVVGIIAVLLALAAGALYLVDTLDDPGRDLGLRTYLWNAALTMAAEKPVAGQGLYTFGRNLPLFDSIPPRQPHSHAHNAPLQIAAEVGIAGVAALAVSVILVLIAIRFNWTRTDGPVRLTLAGTGGAVTAFAVHHLLDLPAMAPAVALVGVMTLAILIAPAQPVALSFRGWRWSRGFGMVVLWVTLLVTGVWSSSVYAAYLDAMRQAVTDEDYRAAAARLEAVIAADPDLSLYQGQQAYLLGLAAREGDTAAGEAAIAAYSRAAELEPYHVPYQVNLGVLLWNRGRFDEGFAAVEHAAALAPDSWQIQYILGLYAEALDRPDVARAAYTQALHANPDADLYPAWGATDIQKGLTSRIDDRSPMVRVTMLLEGGRAGEALSLWEESLTAAESTASLVLRALLALVTGDRDAAVAWLDRASETAGADADPWLLYGAGRLARFDGDAEQGTRLMVQARAASRLEPLQSDDPWAESVAYAQFLRLGLARYFLPQVYYPTIDPALAYLLERADLPLGNW